MDNLIQEVKQADRVLSDEFAELQSVKKAKLTLINAAVALCDRVEELQPMARTIDEWHEDYGDALWWSFPVCEPPYCGSPLADDWPEYHTHWTPFVVPDLPKAAGTTASPSDSGSRISV